MPRIDVVKHAKYIMSVAMRYRKEFPSISLEDIISEMNLLVIQMSEKDYDPKYSVTTFIENFPAKKLRQVLVYKYVNFTYHDRQRVFVENCSIYSHVSEDNELMFTDSLKLVEADKENKYSSIIENELDEFEIVELIQKSNLSCIEKAVMYRRLGINTFKAMTLEEIGMEFNLTRERIRLIEKAAKEKMKNNVINNNVYSMRKEIEETEEID